MINGIERLWVNALKGKREKLLPSRDYQDRFHRGSGIVLERGLANYIPRAKFITSPVSVQPTS